MPMPYRNILFAGIALAFSLAAQAAPLTVLSYDMPNGSGQARGGSFNYWDKEYTGGSGSVTTDGAFLSGGKGNLTDGVTTALNWNNIETVAGTGPYVGWRDITTPKPVVKFNFGGVVGIDSVTVHMDDANGVGGVNVPSHIGISTDGINFTDFAVNDPANSDPFALTLAGLGLTSDAVWVSFTYQNSWIFVDEVSFANANTVPEPNLLSLIGPSLLAFAASRYRGI